MSSSSSFFTGPRYATLLPPPQCSILAAARDAASADTNPLENRNQHAEFTEMQEMPGSRISTERLHARQVNWEQERRALIQDLLARNAANREAYYASLNANPVPAAAAPATAASNGTVRSARRRRLVVGTTADMHRAAREQLRRNEENFTMAQRYHPGEAVVFVGNLQSDRTDAELSAEMTRLFGRDGMWGVHIGRTYDADVDKPWALLQFSTLPLAQNAIIKGNQIVCGGRFLRCSLSNACRELSVRRRDFGFYYPGDYVRARLRGDFGWCGDIEGTTFDGGFGYTIRFRCFGAFELARQAVASGTTEYVFN